LSPEYVAVALAVSVREQDPQTRQQVYQAVQQSLLNFLWPLPPGGRIGQGWPLGLAVDVNELRTVAGRVAGVQAIGGLFLYVRNGAGQWQTLVEGQSLSLQAWQLPELVGINVQADSAGEAPQPPAIVSGTGEREAIKDWIPTPVIPDIC
jgi:hypothetical protein